MIRKIGPTDNEEGIEAEVELLDQNCFILETKLKTFAQEHIPRFIGRVSRSDSTKSIEKILGRYHKKSGEGTGWYYFHEHVYRYGYNRRFSVARNGLHIFKSDENITEATFQHLQHYVMRPGVQHIAERIAAGEKVEGVFYCGREIALVAPLLKVTPTLLGYLFTEDDGGIRYSATICGISSDYKKTDGLLRELVGKGLNSGGLSVPNTIDNPEKLKCP